MRQIFLDTETTGLSPESGDRVIEIGCVELVNRRLTGRKVHFYVNPERRNSTDALAVHGLSDDFLADKPLFAEIADELIEFVRGAELIIHNAAFDVEFLNRELELAKLPSIEEHCAGIVDSLALARELHPGKKNSLDALCERYQVDNAHRTLHGALLDASLLAEVYIAMTRGQDSLAIELEPARGPSEAWVAQGERPALIVVPASEQELAEHDRLLAAIEAENKAPSVWRRFEAAVEVH